MPAVPVPMTLTQQVADIYAQLKRLRTATSTGGGGFDPNADPVVIGLGADGGTTGDGAVAIGNGTTSSGYGATAVGSGAFGQAMWDIAIGWSASASFNAPFSGVDGQDNIAIGRASKAGNNNGGSNSVAIGQGASALPDTSVAIGWQAQATKPNQIIFGTENEFVEIPGSGLVLTDTVSGTRYIIQITSGALVLNAAP